MSATGRSDVRHPDDFYETPAWCVRRFLEANRNNPGRWLEPSAGNGAIIRAVNAHREKSMLVPVRWTAVEKYRYELANPFGPTLLTSGVGPVHYVDFLSPEVATDKPFDYCIGNPPFKLAQEFIEKACLLSKEVAFLLRLNFLEGSKRAAFFKKHACDVFVLPNRPSFTSDGKTDATAYAWFEFGNTRERGHLTMLETTSRAERLADRVAAR